MTKRSLERFLLLGAISTCSVFSSACSIRVNFLIANSDSSPIQITLGLKQTKRDERSSQLPVEQYLSSDVLAKENKVYGINDARRWEAVSRTDCTADESKGEITLTLSPNSTLRIESVTNYREESELCRERFKIEGVRILGSNGEILLKGDQARTHFQKTGSGNREFVYR